MPSSQLYKSPIYPTFKHHQIFSSSYLYSSLQHIKRKKMKKQQSLYTLSLLVLALSCAKILGQSPAAAPAQVQVPAPPVQAPVVPISRPPAASPTHVPLGRAPTNVTNILEKAGHFNVFIRLLKSTQEDNHLLTVLNNSNNGLTILAPTDNAFSNLKSGMLNYLTNEQKSELVKFHVIPTFLAMSHFQTVTNPIATEAGSGGKVALNVTAYPASVNITTGVTNTSLSGTVYSDNQLAIYKVESVLLPIDIVTRKSHAPAPAPVVVEKPKPKPKKEKSPPVVESPPVDVPVAASESSSSQTRHKNHVVVFLGLGIMTVVSLVSLGV